MLVGIDILSSIELIVVGSILLTFAADGALVANTRRCTVVFVAFWVAVFLFVEVDAVLLAEDVVFGAVFIEDVFAVAETVVVGQIGFPSASTSKWLPCSSTYSY